MKLKKPYDKLTDEEKLAFSEYLLTNWLEIAYGMVCCDPYIDLMRQTEIVLGIRNPDGSEK